MKKRTKSYFYLFLIVIVVAMISLVYFKDKQMISSNLEDDTHMTIKVDLEHSSLFVNLYNDSQFSSAQCDDKY